MIYNHGCFSDPETKLISEHPREDISQPYFAYRIILGALLTSVKLVTGFLGLQVRSRHRIALRAL